MTADHDAKPGRSASLQVGVVLRRSPGVTRWAAHAWSVSALIPGAGKGEWKELRREGEVVEFHAATAPLTLWRSDTEAYVVALNAVPPSIWVILRRETPEGRPEVLTVTASAYEAQDYADNGEDIVERVPMPEPLFHWIGAFVEAHHRAEEFVKRKRRPHLEPDGPEGIGDARVRQPADVYRAPKALRERDG